MTSAPPRGRLVQDLLTRLGRIRTEEPVVVSCYLRLDRSAWRNRGHLVELLERVRELNAHLDARDIPEPIRRQIAGDIQRVVRWLAIPGNLPRAPGVAVFAAESVGLFEALALPVVFRGRISVDNHPAIAELAELATGS